MRHVPFWFDSFPKTRRPSLPRFRGSHETRVAIVGGGLTGISCALAFAGAGINVVLLEANLIGGAATAGSDGLLREGFNGSVTESIARYGVRTTRALWEGTRRGSLELAAALRRLEVRCHLTPMDILTISPPRAENAKALRREQGMRKDVGAEAPWVTPAAATREAAVESGGAVRIHAAAIDPYRACLGLAAAAIERGAVMHERSAVRRIKTAQRHVEISTAGGTLKADAVVVATAAPLEDLRALRRHLPASSLYGVVTEPLPAAVRKQVGRRTVAIEDAGPPHRLVRWLPEDRVMIHGGRQPAVPERLRERTLVQRTGQLMYELSLLYPSISGLPPAWSWEVSDYETVDGLPLVGPHRNFPRHLFAFTPARHGAGLSWAAARILLRHYQEEGRRADEAFGFARVL